MDTSNGSHGAGNGFSAAQRELEVLRTELDDVDRHLLEDVRARIEVCTRIARLKRRNSIPMMQPQRIGFVQDRAQTYAVEHELSPDFFRSLYELLIRETCRVEDLIIDADGSEPERMSGPSGRGG
ncbi:chorismate mutase family protein [Rhodococcus sp. NPDC055112]